MIQKRLRQNINTSAIIDNTGNTQDITQLKIDVANNTQQITNNSQEIGTLQTQVAQNTQDITGFNQITTDLQTKYNGLEPKVTQNQSDINALQTTVQDLGPRVTTNEASITAINSTLTNVAKKNEQNTFTMQQNFNADIVLTNSSIKSTTGDLNINEGGSHVQVKTDLIMNDHWIANLHDPNSAQDAATKNYVDNANTAISNRVTNLETSLANGNIVNYVGTYDPATTYAIGQCVTFNDKWYVSKINGNVGNQPDTSSTQWELLSAPAVDLTPYLTKTEASTTYETIANVNALTTRVSTNEQNIANKANTSDLTALSGRVDTNTQDIATINTTLNGVAKLATDNTFTANNTFNNAINVGGTGLKTTIAAFTLVEISNQNQKSSNIDFIQSTGDYKNWCNLKFRHKHRTAQFVDILNVEINPNNDGFVNFKTSTPKFSFSKKIEVKNTNNNGAFLDNFDYNSKNYTSLKLFKNNTTNLLQMEVNNTDNTALISSPSSNNNLSIQNLRTPTNANDAANKAYVDNLIQKYEYNNTASVDTEISLLSGIGWDKKVIGVNVYRKRQNNQWFIYHPDQNVQIYRTDNGDFKLWTGTLSGWSNEFKIQIYYIN